MSKFDYFTYSPSVSDAQHAGSWNKFCGMAPSPAQYDDPELRAAYMAAYNDAYSRAQLEAITPRG